MRLGAGRLELTKGHPTLERKELMRLDAYRRDKFINVMEATSLTTNSHNSFDSGSIKNS